MRNMRENLLVKKYFIYQPKSAYLENIYKLKSANSDNIYKPKSAYPGNIYQSENRQNVRTECPDVLYFWGCILFFTE